MFSQFSAVSKTGWKLGNLKWLLTRLQTEDQPDFANRTGCLLTSEILLASMLPHMPS